MVLRQKAWNPKNDSQEIAEPMKARHCIARLACLGTTLALMLLGTGCASTGASSTPRVFEERQFIPLHHVKNTGHALRPMKRDPIATACAKCKTVLYVNVDKPRTRFFAPFEYRHYCPACKSTITVTGNGLKATEEVEHTCAACGGDSVFCGATVVDRSPTPGMENKEPTSGGATLRDSKTRL